MHSTGRDLTTISFPVLPTSMLDGDSENAFEPEVADLDGALQSDDELDESQGQRVRLRFTRGLLKVKFKMKVSG